MFISTHDESCILMVSCPFVALEIYMLKSNQSDGSQVKMSVIVGMGAAAQLDGIFILRLFPDVYIRIYFEAVASPKLIKCCSSVPPVGSNFGI